MNIETSITKQINPNQVEVKITHHKTSTQYYAVPNQNAKNFCEEYKNNLKNVNLVNNIVMLVSGIGGVTMCNTLTKKLSNNVMRIIINIIGASGCIMGATHITNKHYIDKTDETIRKFGAKKLIYNA